MAPYKISACIITRDEPLLLGALQSIRPFVDEIVVVDTGYSESVPAAFSLADTWVTYHDCNDAEGNIADFSDARNFSLSLASNQIIMWIDSDDVFVGGEHLQEVIAEAIEKAGAMDWRVVAPYNYLHNEHGECVSFQARERIVSDKSKFKWQDPVHESLVPAFGQESLNVDTDKIRWIHKRTSQVPSYRNLRILRRQAKAIEASGEHIPVKLRFYLGTEFARTGDHLKAINNLIGYINESGWDEERVLACMQLVKIHTFYPGREDDAIFWGQRAIDIRPTWCEGYFAVAKTEYKLASSDKAQEKKHLRRVVHFARKGLSCMATNSPITTDPADRAINIPLMLQDCFDRLDMPRERLEMLDVCISARPNDAGLKLLRHNAINAPYTGKNIVIACAQTDEQWNPDTAAINGIGGSETAVIKMAALLVKAGHRVRVFCSTPTEGLFEGVEYLSLENISQVQDCDLLIAWRDAAVMNYVPARAKWLWVHDTGFAGADDWNLHLVDRYLALSQWHAKYLIDTFDIEWEKVSVTHNGIDLSRFEAKPERNPHRVIYSSSPDRGLEQLLDAWPDVLAIDPEAELHVFYGSRLLEHFAAMNPDGAEDLFLKAIQAKQKQPGVFVHGRVSQDVLADEMLRSGVWVHPSTMPVGEAFFETSCIGSAEAQAAGLAVVYRPVGALTETVRSGIPTEIENLAANISYALRAVHNRALIQAGISDFTWDSVAEQWSKWIEADMSKNVRDIPKKDNKTVIHMVLAPRASGGMVIDAAAPGNVAHGGGCRAGFMGLAASLPALGYKVRAFSTFDDVMVERDGVEYVRLDHMRRFPKPDVLLAYYDTSPLVEQTGMLRIASHHTYTPYANFDWADVNTAPSTRAREHLRARYEPCGEWQTLPNGVQISLPRTPVSGRVIYHTSPDRGLHILLAVWPEVRKRVPHATLHVVGNVLEAIAPADMEYLRPQLRRRATLLRDGLAAAQAAGGVELLGRLTREALDKELSEASAFAFPCSVSEPCETFSISIMECLAIGMPVVLAPADALGDIYAGALEMTPAPIEDHVQEFTDALVKTLLEPSQTLVDAGKALAAKHSFENKAKTLDMIIRQYRSDSVV